MLTKVMLDNMDALPTMTDEDRYNCTECDDNKYHLYVNRRTGLYHCFKCGYSGKIKSELTLEDFDNQVNEYSKLVNAIGGMASPKILTYSDPIPEKKTLPLHYNIDRTHTQHPAYQYLVKRQLTKKQIKRFKISAELCGPYSNTVIFPVYVYEKLKYFVCRKWDDTEPKYINAPWEKDGMLSITNNTSNIYVITEGIFDALAVDRLGYNTVCLLGKTANELQLQGLATKDYQYIVMLDSDALDYMIHLTLKLQSLNKRAVAGVLIAGDPASNSPDELKRTIKHGIERLKKLQM